MDKLHPSRIEITNFGRIGSATLALGDTCLQMIVGPCGAGKTTILTALAACVSGKRACPAIPLKKGESEGSIKLTLSHGLQDRYEVIRAWKTGDDDKVHEYFHVYEIAEGGRKAVAKPQTFLNDMLTTASFSPTEFLKADDAARLKMMLAAIGKIEDYNTNRAERKAVYDGRTETNRQVESLKQQIQQAPDPAPSEDLDPIGDTEVQQQLAETQAQNEARRQAEEGVEASKRQIEEATRNIAAWQERAAAAEAQRLELAGRLEKMPPAVDPAELARKLTQIHEHNVRVKQQQAARELSHKIANQQQVAIGATAKIEALDRALEAIIETSSIGKHVPGLTVKQGACFLNDIPLEDAGGREKRTVSTLVGMASNPDLRTMRIDEADGIDDEGLNHFAELAREHEFMLFLAGVRLDNETVPSAAVFRLEDGAIVETKPAVADGEAGMEVASPSAVWGRSGDKTVVAVQADATPASSTKPNFVDSL